MTKTLDPMRDVAALGRGRYLHFGCGPHHLPRPWENFDREVNLRKPLPFPTACAEYVVASHVIEHLPFLQGMGFLREVHRVLEPAGMLRLSFPDVSRFNDANTPLYLAWLQSQAIHIDSFAGIARFLLESNGHESAWTLHVGEAALLAAGFSAVTESHYGRSRHVMLDGIDGHHFTSSLTAATIETTVLEATK